MGSVIPDICVIFHSAIPPSAFSARSRSCLGGGQSGVWNLLATSEGSPSPGKQCLTSGTACQRWDNGHCKCLLNGDNCAGFTARVHACWCGQQVLPHPTEMLSKMKALFPHPQEPIRDRCRHRDISAKAHHHLRSRSLSSASPYPMTGGYEDMTLFSQSPTTGKGIAPPWLSVAQLRPLPQLYLSQPPWFPS